MHTDRRRTFNSVSVNAVRTLEFAARKNVLSVFKRASRFKHRTGVNIRDTYITRAIYRSARFVEPPVP